MWVYSFKYTDVVRTISIKHARANLAETLDAVVNDSEPTIITRAGHEPVVVLSLDEYNSMRETMHLKRSPANAARLAASIARIEAGRCTLP